MTQAFCSATMAKKQNISLNFSMKDLIRMDDNQLKKVKALIRKECANYINGDCLLLEWNFEPCRCPQMISKSLVCKWFRNAVLPLNTKLLAELSPDAAHKKSCAVCGNKFISGSNRARYCSECAVRIKRQKTRDRARKYRLGM